MQQETWTQAQGREYFATGKQPPRPGQAHAGEKSRPARVKRLGATEHDEQCALMELVALHLERMPELRALYAVPNQRASKGEAGRLKAEGAKRGVWDLHLPVPRAGRPGLWIEMKVGDNDLSPEQRQWGAFMRALGHRCEVCYSAEEAWRVLVEYLSGGPR